MGKAPKFKVKTAVLAPAETKTIQFFGNDPGQVFKLIPELLMEVFKIDPGALWEDDIRWNTSDDPVSFYGYWRGKERKDAYTVLWIEIEARGTQTKQDKKGDVSIVVKGNLKSSFEYPTFIHRGIYWTYMLLFYKKQIARYMLDANRMIVDFENTVRDHFNLMRKGEM